MYSVKLSSTQQANKKENESCPVTFTLNKIGGRWKPLILYYLLSGPQRYNGIRKSLPNISEKMLIQTLRELETDGIIEREVRVMVPPHVIYSLSSSGKALEPIFNSMAEWGNDFKRDK